MKELWEDLRRELSSPPTLGIVIIVIANSINASFVCLQENPLYDWDTEMDESVFNTGR